jgi:hypothetical protein
MTEQLAKIDMEKTEALGLSNTKLKAVIKKKKKKPTSMSKGRHTGNRKYRKLWRTPETILKIEPNETKNMTIKLKLRRRV